MPVLYILHLPSTRMEILVGMDEDDATRQINFFTFVHRTEKQCPLALQEVRYCMKRHLRNIKGRPLLKTSVHMLLFISEPIHIKSKYKVNVIMKCLSFPMILKTG